MSVPSEIFSPGNPITVHSQDSITDLAFAIRKKTLVEKPLRLFPSPFPLMTTPAILFGATTPFDPTHKLVTSPFLSPTVLACCRGLVALYTTCTLIFLLAYESVTTKDAGEIFSYFTFLTYIGICSYYWASLVQTFWYIRRGFEGYPLQNWGETLQVLHLMLQNTIMNLPIIVTVAFWVLIASPSSLGTTMNRWNNISVHALNSCFCMFEVVMTNNPPPQWIFLPFMLLIIALYTASGYVTFATQGFYPYEFLDPVKYHWIVAVYILGTLGAEIVVFVVVWGIMKLRERIFPGRKSEMDHVERGDERFQRNIPLMTRDYLSASVQT